MERLKNFYFLIAVMLFESVTSSLLCTEKGSTPCHSPYDVDAHPEDRPKYEAIHLSKDFPKRPEISTLLEKADKMVEDWNTFQSSLQQNENTESDRVLGNSIDHSDIYDLSEGYEAKDFTEHPDMSTLLEKANEMLNDWNTFQSSLKKIEMMGTNVENKHLNGNARARSDIYNPLEGIEQATQSFNAQQDFLLSSDDNKPGGEDVNAPPNDLKDILLGNLKEETFGESRVTFQKAEDNDVSGVQLIKSKCADKQRSNIKRHRRGDPIPTKSTPIEINQIFREHLEDAVKITQLAEGGGVTLTSASLSGTSPGPVSSKTAITPDEEKQSSSTLSVKGSVLPLNGAPTPSTTRLTTDVNRLETSTISQEHILDKGPDKEPVVDVKSHKTVPRKGAEAGIVGRKGVNELNVDVAPMASSSANKSSSGDFISNPQNASQSIVSKGEVIESNPPLIKKPKNKPLTLTDKTSFNSSAEDSLIHNQKPSQTDYVVPIVILMLAVPLVTILGTLLYKKGSEYWSRRHYRRMDFLIDGMYHD